MNKNRKISTYELIEKICSLGLLPKTKNKGRFTKNQLVHLQLYISELNIANIELKKIIVEGKFSDEKSDR